MVAERETLRDVAIVTSLVPFGEADLVVRVYARGAGRVGLFAKGGRKSKRKYPGLGPLAVGEIAYRGRPGASLDALEEADLSQDVDGLGRDVEAFGRASYLAELCERLLPEREPHPELFDLLVEARGLLGQGRGDARLLRAFELKLLGYTGYLPDFSPPKGGTVAGFEPVAGRFVADMGPGTLPFSDQGREDAILLVGAGLDTPPDVDEARLREVGRIFAAHLRRMGTGPLKSVAFLKALKGA